jgi:micrococcal nuclease
MLSEIALPYLQKFNRLPIYLKGIAIVVMAWLLVAAWPILVALIFGLVVFSTMQSPKSRYALAVVMLAPALFMEGYWVNSLWTGLSNGSNEVVASPSQVALADHNNQIQGAQSEQSSQVRVVRAISGDTIEVDQRGEQYRIRLVGIEAPRPGEGANSAQCFGDESKLFLNSLLENRMIDVIADTITGDKDENGSLLRYIRMADGTKVNELMLEAGLARELTNQDFEQKDIYVELAASADQHNKGLWASCSDDGQPKITPAPSVVVTPTPRSNQPEPTGIAPVNPNLKD